MALSFGKAKGLAQSLQYDARQNDLRFINEYERRSKAEAIARAQAEAKDMEFTHAANPFDEQKVKDNANSVITEVGKYKQANPDWEWNTQKRAVVNAKLSELRNNDALLRSIQYKDAYNQYLNDRQEAMKNPESWDMERLDEEGRKFDNYIKTGHFEGSEGLSRDGSYKAPVYTRPQALVQVIPTLQTIGKNTNDFEVKKGTNIGEYWHEIKPDQLEQLADQAMTEHSRSIEKEAKKRGLTDPADIRNMVKTIINSGFDKKYSLGDSNALFQRKMEMLNYNLRKQAMQPKAEAPQNTEGTWSDLIKKGAALVNTESVAKVVGTTPVTPVYTNSGKSIDLSGLNYVSNGKAVKNNGVMYFLGDVEVPLAVAYQKGIIDEYDESDEKAATATSARITGDFKGKAAFGTRYDKDGNARKYVKVSYAYPADPKDSSLQQRWDSYHMPDSKVPTVESQKRRTPPPGSQVDSRGNVFDAEGNYIGNVKEF
jgi:hypothetical protein